MLSNNTVNEYPTTSIPARNKVDDDNPQNKDELSKLTSEIDFVSSSAQNLFIQKNTSTPRPDGFLTRVWRCL